MSLRHRGAIAAGLLLLTGTAACGDDDKIALGDRVTTTAESTTTTEESTTTTDAATTTTTTNAVGLGAHRGRAAGTQTGWELNAGPFRSEVGRRIEYVCPPDGVLGAVWGTGPFTDDSSVCSAAVFAGHFTTETGGSVVIEIVPGQQTYAGGQANGVTTGSYGPWGGSFSLVPPGG